MTNTIKYTERFSRLLDKTGYDLGGGWELWYDRGTRTWWANEFTAEGDQIHNESFFAHHKQDVIDRVKQEQGK